jgi:hypothetical protein
MVDPRVVHAFRLTTSRRETLGQRGGSQRQLGNQICSCQNQNGTCWAVQIG